MNNTINNQRLKEALRYVADNSPFYKEWNINVESISSIKDLQKLPVTTKQDLQQRNKDFLCVPPAKIIDYVTTSGTLGEPVTFALTEKDLERLACNEAQSFATTGCTPATSDNSGDIIQIMTTIDRRFMAGLAYFLGARKLGCGIIRVGNGIPELQWDSIKRINPTTCIVVPSFLLKLIDFAKENKIDYQNCSLKRAICIGEALRNEDFSLNTLGKQIHEQWQKLELYSTYASTEMQTSITECNAFKGGHIPENLLVVEFLDENNKAVGEHEAGEVTITTLGVEGMPLLRFKTGDICYHHNEKCSCGRSSTRLSPVLGRKGEMIKYKGTTLYPPAMYDILNNISEISNYIVEVYTNKIGTDEIIVRVSSEKAGDELQKKIKNLFRSKVRVAPEVIFEHEEIIARMQNPAMARKTKKFIDQRVN